MQFRPLKQVNRIVVHCSGEGFETADDIDKVHRGWGWLKIGYHFVIERDGAIVQGRRVTEIGAHAKGYNSDSIAYCMVGGNDDGEADFTEEQYRTLRRELAGWTVVEPDVQILGHRDLPDVAKVCPCFDVREWFYNTGESK